MIRPVHQDLFQTGIDATVVAAYVTIYLFLAILTWTLYFVESKPSSPLFPVHWRGERFAPHTRRMKRSASVWTAAATQWVPSKTFFICDRHVWFEWPDSALGRALYRDTKQSQKQQWPQAHIHVLISASSSCWEFIWVCNHAQRRNFVTTTDSHVHTSLEYSMQNSPTSLQSSGFKRHGTGFLQQK